MAIDPKGVQNSLPPNQVPSGHTRSVASDRFRDNTTTSDRTLSILKATVENASKDTTMTNLVSDAAIGISKQVDDLMGAEYDDTAKTVTYWTDWRTLRDNIGNDASTDFLNDTAVSYVVQVRIFIKVS